MVVVLVVVLVVAVIVVVKKESNIGKELEKGGRIKEAPQTCTLLSLT